MRAKRACTPAKFRVIESAPEVLPMFETVAGAVLLAFFSLSLAPWFGGTEIGSIKVPKFSAKTNRWLRVVGPTAFVVCLLVFLKIGLVLKETPTVQKEEPTGKQIGAALRLSLAVVLHTT